MWDFSQYNLIVRQVEHCSDVLHVVADRIEMQLDFPAGSPNTFRRDPPNRIAMRLKKHTEQAAIDLDKRAIRMLALYDAYAQHLVKTGVHYDPRRPIVRPAVPRKAPKKKKGATL